MRIFSREQSRPMLAILIKERIYWKDLRGTPNPQEARESCLKIGVRGGQMNQGYPTGIAWPFTSTPMRMILTSNIPFVCASLGQDLKSWDRVSTWLSMPWLCQGVSWGRIGTLNLCSCSEMGEGALGIAFSLRLATRLNFPKREIQMLNGEEGMLDNGWQQQQNPVQKCSSRYCLS